MTTLTPAAAAELKRILDEENDPSLNLRLYVTGGGCSGFKYGFTFSDEVNDDDTVVEESGVKIYIDSMSIPYLINATFDFRKDQFKSEFVFNNPSVKGTCGCGSSFAS